MRNFYSIVVCFTIIGCKSYELGDEYLFRFGDITRKTIRRSIRSIPDITIQLGSPLHAENDYVKFFLHQQTCSVTISTYEIRDSTDTENREHYVVTCSMDNLKVVANKFARKAGLFFFVITDAITREDFTEIFRDLWRRQGVFRVYLLTVVGIFLYDPFFYDNNGNYGQIVDIEKRNLTTIFKDMNGYPLRVQIFRSVYSKIEFDESKRVKRAVGADAKVAYLLAEKMNYTMILQQPEPDLFGTKLSNGSFDGTIGKIIRNETDISLSGYFVKDYFTRDIEFTATVYEDMLCCYLPKADRVPQSILPIVAVKYDIWIGFLITPLLCAIIWIIIRKCNSAIFNHSKNITRLQCFRILVDTWVVWVRVNIMKFPPFHSERIFVISLCLVSVIFGALLESSLSTSYITPLYYKDINTLRELDESGYKIYYKYSSMADDLFFSETSPLFASLGKKLAYINNVNLDMMKTLVDKGHMAAVTRYSSLKVESISYLVSKKVIYVPECPKTYGIAYVVPKDFAFLEIINDVLLRITSAGLIEHWIKEMFDKASISLIQSHILDEQPLKILSLADLQLAFYLLFGGAVFAGLSLSIEICMSKKK
ncbi:hypothetical protein ACFFRR_002428 [Megaselia abdita]